MNTGESGNGGQLTELMNCGSPIVAKGGLDLMTIHWGAVICWKCFD